MRGDVATLTSQILQDLCGYHAPGLREVSMAVKNRDIVVFSILKPSACSQCGVERFPGNFLRIEAERPLCLKCAHLDHLVWLPAGDTALTRRSRKYSSLCAVVLRFSRSRGQYERQGLLVEAAALERAQSECVSDEGRRRLARGRAAVTRKRADARFVRQFAERIRSLYPGCPEEEALAVAARACEKHSGRVGRSAAAKDLAAEAVDLAVKAHIRHTHTKYDDLLASGWERAEARASTTSEVDQVVQRWRRGG